MGTEENIEKMQHSPGRISAVRMILQIFNDVIYEFKRQRSRLRKCNQGL